ncbi:MAG: hypothetical protein ACYTGN_16335 [Planctomycetota bacterium]|jgi:hypothetical protein
MAGRCLALLCLCAWAHADGAQWNLGASDWARYEERDAAKKKTDPRIVSVFGHEVKSGQFALVFPRRADLPALLGFRLPSGPDLKRLKLGAVVELRLKGKLSADADRFAGEWTFKSQGKPDRKDTHAIQKGRARVEASFDPKQGVFRFARVEIEYVLRKLDPKPGEKPKAVKQTRLIKLSEIRRRAHTGFFDHVNAAIDRGVKHLRTLKKEDGTFEPHGKHVFGTTALVVLTLTACGVPKEDPDVEKAMAWMALQFPEKTYELAVGLMAFERAYTPPDESARKRVTTFRRDLPPDRRAWCVRAAKTLEKIATAHGSWEYKAHNSRFIANPDSSNTQYGVLGLRAATRLGLAVDERTWLGVVRHFQGVRERKAKRGAVELLYEGQAEGEAVAVKVPEAAGFKYRVGHTRVWGSMTSAGICSLAVARHQLRRMKSPKIKALERRIEEMILGGWAWLDANWSLERNPHKLGGAWYFYYLYTLERAAILTGVKRVGGRDWYFEGADQLLARQDAKKGSWNEGGGKDVSETCFALLFLKRATAPLSGGR